MYFIYILHSPSSGKYYIGYSNDPWKRLIEHNSVNHPTFTSKHRPWLLKAVFEVGENEKDAIRLERFIKAQHSKILIEKLVDSGLMLTGKLAQLVRVPHVRD